MNFHIRCRFRITKTHCGAEPTIYDIWYHNEARTRQGRGIVYVPCPECLVKRVAARGCLTAAKLFQYSTPDPFSECILWDGGQSDRGYGYIRIAKDELPELPRMSRAHRVAYWLIRGPFPLALTLDHTCHVRLCVNAYHMNLETHEAHGAMSSNYRWSDYGEEEEEYEPDGIF